MNLNPTREDNFDSRPGYVEVDAESHGRVRFRVGRQELSFGAQRLVGAFDWGNTARRFDAARLTLAWTRARGCLRRVGCGDPPDQSRPQPAGREPLGHLHFVQRRLRKNHAQPCVFWQTDPRVVSEEGRPGDEDLFTLGFRWTGQWPAGFDTEMELARQAGNFSNDSIDAWAGYWIGGYTLTRISFKPRFSIESDYASGDKRAGNGKVGTFGQLFPTNHIYSGITDQVGWKNMPALRTGVGFSPRRSLKGNFENYFFGLASP